MEPGFEVNPELRRAAEAHETAFQAENAHRATGMKASEMLAANVDVPFSMRLGARERALLFALAEESGKSMSQLARELLVEGLVRLRGARGSQGDAGESTELGAFVANIRTLAMLAQSVEAQAERITRPGS